MPIAAVSREPGRIEAQNGADLARAQPCDQAVESEARHRSACWSAEIVIDDFNIDETVLAATSTRSYWRRLLSRLVMTWDCVDWRTYTTAFLLRTTDGIISVLVIVKLLDA
jgi:hypothetical protein